MAVGDVTSTARGSGARFNDGKVPLDLLPLRVFAASLLKPGHNELQSQALLALNYLAEWQESGQTACLYEAIAALGNPWRECARVFDHGRRKYSEWNWSKGMAWSVPLGCAVRHLERIVVDDEAMDSESGLPHVGHVLCNLAMLITFKCTYPEGDDRPRTLVPTLSPPIRVGDVGA